MRKDGLSGRKGNAILDTTTIVVLLVIFAIISVIGRFVLNDINTDVQADGDMSAGAKAALGNVNTNYPTAMDAAIILAFVLLWIFALVASFLIDTHPAMMAVAIILMIFLVLISATLANTYEDIVTDEGIAGPTYFPLTTFLMKHLVQYFIVVCGSVMIVLYGKSKAGE